MIDADDLALLASSFRAAMLSAEDPGAADQALFDLGWADLLAVEPHQGAIAAFTELGNTESGACLLDDVVAQALGLSVALDTCIVMPEPHGCQPPGVLVDGRVQLNGLISGRADRVQRALVPLANSTRIAVVDLAARARCACSTGPPIRRACSSTTACLGVNSGNGSGSCSFGIASTNVTLRVPA